MNESSTPRILPDGRVVAVPTRFTGRAKLHKHAQIRDLKLARIHDPHVADLTDFVEIVRLERGAFVPYVDPDSAGVTAKVLFVLESAGKATLTSQMVSADNNDDVAKALWVAHHDTGMPRDLAVHWNVVPWYVGNDRRSRKPSLDEVRLGRSYLTRLVELLPALECVVAMGRPAQNGVRPLVRTWGERGISVLATPHPSPRVVTMTKGESRREMHETIRMAMQLVRPLPTQVRLAVPAVLRERDVARAR